MVLNNPDFATNMAIGLYCVFRGPILSDLSRFNQNVVGKLKEYCDVWGAQDNSYNCLPCPWMPQTASGTVP